MSWQSIPFGPHPYISDVCWNERGDLKDVFNKQKKCRVTPGKSHLGVFVVLGNVMHQSQRLNQKK